MRLELLLLCMMMLLLLLVLLLADRGLGVSHFRLKYLLLLRRQRVKMLLHLFSR